MNAQMHKIPTGLLEKSPITLPTRKKSFKFVVSNHILEGEKTAGAPVRMYLDISHNAGIDKNTTALNAKNIFFKL
jgi:hypothetical protein